MPGQRPAPRAAGGGAAGGQQQQQEGGGAQGIFRAVLNGVLIFIAVNTLMKQFVGDQKPAPSTASSFNSEGREVPPIGKHWAIPQSIYPLWPTGTPMDISIYLSESLTLPPLSNPAVKKNKVFGEKNFKLNDMSDRRVVSVDVPFSRRVQNNGTLWAHIFVAESGAVMDPNDKRYDEAKAFRIVKLMTRYMPMRKVVRTKKLIGGGSEAADENEEPEIQTVDVHGNRIIRSYWHSNLTLDVVAESGVLGYPESPPPLRQHIRLESSGKRDESGMNGWYYPIVFVNDFWLLKEHMVELNETVTSLPLHIHLQSTPWWKFQVYATLDESFKQQANNPALGGAGSTGGELEELKRVLVDTNIYLLATTIGVSILHSIFEILAFKSDISHWRHKKDNVGVSFRTILANVLMQTIIFLYLIDNSDGTSWMILFGQGFGILLEAWKITKTVDVKVRPAPPGSLLPIRIAFEDKHNLSDLEKETQTYDQIAFKYLYMVAVPLLLAYAAYSLLYETHKSWYSFIITTLVGSVYAYGFLMMVPSLYINYRLKSVAHMPRKAMMYKFLNTFIDDLFAFTIKMPTLHRLATLRDDVIFFIYLYQAYYYRVDYKRINEFGQGGEEEGPAAEPVVAAVEGKDGGEKVKEATEEVEGNIEIVDTAGTTTGSGASTSKGKVRRR